MKNDGDYVVLLRPQTSPKGGMQYVTFIENKVTIVNYPKADQPRFALIKVVKDLGQIQFANIIEFLEAMPIAKSELIDHVGRSSEYQLKSYRNFDIVDEIYAHPDFCIEAIQAFLGYLICNVIMMELKVVGASRDVVLFKTKYGISTMSYNNFQGITRHCGFGRYEVQPIATIRHSEYRYKTKEEWMKR